MTARPSSNQPDGLARRTSSMTPRTPTTGVGLMEESGRPLAAPWELYRETLPPVTGTPMALQASARPVMISTSCHMASGSSGEPTLRQSVTARGRAPTVHTLR